MNRAIRFWFLETVIEVRRSPCLFWPELRGGVINMPPVPGLRPNDYVDHLIELAWQGSIAFYRKVSAPELEAAPLVPSEIRSAIATEGIDHVFYELTAKGGGQWEAESHPQWDQYVGEVSDSDSAEMWSSNRDRLIALVGWLPALRGWKPLPGTMKLTFHKNYQITYWKSLPNIHKVTFEFAECKKAPPLSLPDWLERWAIPRWYLDPWDHPEWPAKNITP